ncbi:MAG: leucine-rich repeat domain-containing protein [Lentisphaeria bacterium]|nr:leucine-rich repeat domain-containing protein [Lentisphaeria bacterium]
MTGTKNHPSGLMEAQGNDAAPSVSFAGRLKAYVLTALLLAIPFVILVLFGFPWYMYVCELPAGTTVVERFGIPWRSRLGEYCYSSGLTLKYPWLKPYLGYRHFIIPEGAVEIGEQSFGNGDIRGELRSVRIPGSMKKIDRYAFAWCEKLTDIAIPDSVEEIGYSAFRECRALQEVVIPGSVKMIDGGMFEYCTGLRKVVLRDGVKVIGGGAFRNCTALRTVDIPDSVEFIMMAAFQNCTSLEEIRLPAGMVRQLTEEEKERLASAPSVTGSTGPEPIVCPLAFAGCIALKKVTLPDGITIIGSNSFQDCKALSEFNIPDSVTEIGSEAFLGCRNLPPLTIPRGLHVILGGAFTGTGCRLTVPDDHPTLRFEDGILYGKDGERRSVISCVTAPPGTCAIDPDTTHIRGRAFFGCGDLTDVRLPDGLKVIGERAFSGCTGLKELVLPDSLTSVAREAFEGCTGLKSVTIPGSLNTIPYGMFRGCSQLEEVVIPEGVVFIEDEAFKGCTSLRRVTFPDSLGNLGPKTFSGCKSLDEETRARLEYLTGTPGYGLE